jgi:hypothetical protein
MMGKLPLQSLLRSVSWPEYWRFTYFGSPTGGVLRFASAIDNSAE